MLPKSRARPTFLPVLNLHQTDVRMSEARRQARDFNRSATKERRTCCALVERRNTFLYGGEGSSEIFSLRLSRLIRRQRQTVLVQATTDITEQTIPSTQNADDRVIVAAVGEEERVRSAPRGNDRRYDIAEWKLRLAQPFRGWKLNDLHTASTPCRQGWRCYVRQGDTRYDF